MPIRLGGRRLWVRAATRPPLRIACDARLPPSELPSSLGLIPNLCELLCVGGSSPRPPLLARRGGARRPRWGIAASYGKDRAQVGTTPLPRARGLGLRVRAGYSPAGTC